MHPTLATRFGQSTTRVLRADQPLSEDQMRGAAPSIFATGKHASRSDRYTYIPTIEVLRGLRREGFEPFMVAQGSSRVEGKSAYTKHMIRMRHANQVQTRSEANEIILINSHDGASSYQFLAGAFRFVCHNGLVVGNVVEDLRIPHKGDIQGEVIEGAIRVLGQFEIVDEHIGAMKALPSRVFIGPFNRVCPDCGRQGDRQGEACLLSRARDINEVAVCQRLTARVFVNDHRVGEGAEVDQRRQVQRARPRRPRSVG